jgi:hypothetical protein
MDGVLIIDVIFWFIGTVFQRKLNTVTARGEAKGPEPQHIISSLLWTYLFGVRPKIEKVYLVPAFALQVPALLHLVLGGIALWINNSTAYLVITIICWPLIPLIALGREMLRMGKGNYAAKPAAAVSEPPD